MLVQPAGKVKLVGAVAGVALALASALLPSPQGLETIKRHEGLSQVAYYDAVKVPTICYGSTGKVFIGQWATMKECDERLMEDATYAGRAVAKYVHVRLTQGQYDALVSFVYNVGGTAFRKSTMLKRINAGECEAAGREFNRWVYAKGKRLRGLVQRRADERSEWDKGCAAWTY